MTKVDEIECDVCKEFISTKARMHLKRSTFRAWILKKKRRYTSYDGTSAVVTRNIDICDNCWKEILVEVEKRTEE